jgi:hypothetical protein
LVDEIAIVHEFANERIDLPQAELRNTFQIAAHAELSLLVINMVAEGTDFEYPRVRLATLVAKP